MGCREVTFGEFTTLAKQRGWTVDYLAELFRGKFGSRGDVRDMFDRMFQRRFADNVIPYRSVLEFVERELGYQQDATGRERRCACGCGARVFDRRRWASETCRKRVQRRKVRAGQNSPEKGPDLLAPTRDISGGSVPMPTCPAFERTEALRAPEL